MNEETRSRILPQNGEATDRKPWQTPVVEEMAVGQTEDDFTAGPDSGDFFGPPS